MGDPPSDADSLIYATRGLEPAYKELITSSRTRDSVVPFEELFDKIIDHETFLLHNEKQSFSTEPPTANLAKHSSFFHKTFKPKSLSHSRPLFPTPPFPPTPQSPSRLNNRNKYSTSNPVTCQYCDEPGHTVTRCFKLFSHIWPQRPIANHVAFPSSPQNQWIVDSSASHHGNKYYDFPILFNNCI